MLGNNDRMVFSNKADIVGQSIRTGVPLLNRLDELEQRVDALTQWTLTNRGETLHWIGW
jgi:hypothetical protein